MRKILTLIMTIAGFLSLVMTLVNGWLAMRPLAKSNVSATPTPEILLLIGSEPFVCLPVKTVLAWTTTPNPTVQIWTPTPEPTPTRLVTNTPPPIVCNPVATAVILTTELRIRSGPGTQYGVLGSVKKGDSVSIKIIGDGWLKLCGEGWISGSSLYVQVQTR